MPMSNELLKLGSREAVQRRGALGLLFYKDHPVVMRAPHEDKFKEEAVFAPRLEKDEEKESELLQLFAQGLLADSWTLPGGAIEPGEFHEDTVRREFAEEVVMSLEDHRPLDMRLAKSITQSDVHIERQYNIPIPVVVQTNKSEEHSEPYLRGVFEVYPARIDLTEDQFFPLLGAGIFRYLTDVHITEKLRPTVSYLWSTYRNFQLAERKRRQSAR